MSLSPPLLALAGVSRSFGPVEVLHGVSLALYPGRVHALIGENGAGKSTTMKILAGLQPPSEGAVLLSGQPVRFSSPGEAEACGISMIHQEFNLADQLSIEENIFLGREIRRGIFLGKQQMRAATRQALDRLKCSADTSRRVSSLSNSDKQMVEIAKAMLRETRVLIMDEPTAVLTRRETDILLEQIRALKAGGTAVLFTSHKLDEVREIADDLTIMRDGRVVYSGPADLSEAQMASAMVGREIAALYPPKDSEAGQTLLEVQDLTVPGYARGLNFTLAEGEILGIAGLIGSGRTEAFEGLAGLRPASGRIRIAGRELSIRQPWQALENGLAYLTEDRKSRGLLLGKGMTENLTLQALARFVKAGRINRKAEAAALDQAIRDFDIRGARHVSVGHLSGGNQQKLLFARTMLSDPRIIVIDEPTRGIDIGTKEQMYSFIRALARQGRAIVVISSEMQEVIGLADRVLVMRQGQIAGALSGAAITEDAIVHYAMGISPGLAEENV